MKLLKLSLLFGLSTSLLASSPVAILIDKATSCTKENNKIIVNSYDASYSIAIVKASNLAKTLIKDHNIKASAIKVVGYKSDSQSLQVNCLANK